MNLSRRAQFLVDNLDLPAATGVDNARWEHFQLAHLSDDGTFRIENKSRQIAWSWLAAAEAVAEAILEQSGTIFVSYNLDEASEKIRYARLVYESLRIAGLPRIKRDSVLSLEFDGGGRLVSLPSRPPRGKARMNVVLDEYAHAQRDREIYTAALPIISKGGRLRVGSSPLGASGVFWEIIEERLRPYPGYQHKRTPWWEVQAFCRNVGEARKLAPGMTTADRVDLFGNERIRAIYANMPEEDFQQEYECAFVDETTAWITWDVIRKNQQAFDDGGLVWYQAKTVDEALALLPSIKQALNLGRIEAVLAGGIDIGRKRDLSEFITVGLATTGALPLRVRVSLDRVPFDDQRTVFETFIRELPFVQVLVDQNGIGMQLAEQLEKTGRATGVTFTNATKALWAVEARLQAGRTNTPLPAEREIAYQIHSIKKAVTPAKNVVFDTARNEKHHADIFWGWALALSAANIGVGNTVEYGENPLAGYRG